MRFCCTRWGTRLRWRTNICVGLPSGTGCSASIARWQAIQDNDLNSGHVGQSVYNQIQKDIEQASAACQAGKDAEAEAIVRASRARHGYPAG